MKANSKNMTYTVAGKPSVQDLLSTKGPRSEEEECHPFPLKWVITGDSPTHLPEYRYVHLTCSSTKCHVPSHCFNLNPSAAMSLATVSCPIPDPALPGFELSSLWKNNRVLVPGPLYCPVRPCQLQPGDWSGPPPPAAPSPPSPPPPPAPPQLSDPQ